MKGTAQTGLSIEIREGEGRMTSVILIVIARARLECTFAGQLNRVSGLVRKNSLDASIPIEGWRARRTKPVDMNDYP